MSSLSTLKKTGIALLSVAVLTKGAQWAMGLYNLKSNINYKVKFGRVQKFYFNNLEPVATVVLLLEIINTSNFKLNVKDFSTTILSPAGSLIANTNGADINIVARGSFKTEIAVNISIGQLLVSLANSYKLKYVSRLTIAGIQITTPTSTLDIGPQIKEAAKTVGVLNSYIANYKKASTVKGLGESSGNYPLLAQTNWIQ